MGKLSDLPDELLLLILSKVGHAPTLLDSVPLVCKHWKALAREAQVWSGVDLQLPEVPDREVGEGPPGVETRALLHAPVIRSLTLHPSSYRCTYLARALNRGRIVVLDKVDCDYCPALTSFKSPSKCDVKTAILDLLLRSGDHLRYLRTFCDDRPYQPYLLEEPTLMGVLPALKNLEELRLHWTVPHSMTTPAQRYKDTVEGGLPNLRVISTWGETPYDMLLNLVRHATGTLRCFKEPRELTPELSDLLSRCSEMREVRGRPEYLKLVPHWPLLSKLQLAYPSFVTAERVDRFKEDLDVCAGIPLLRLLRLYYPLLDDDDQDEDYLRRAEGYVADFKARRPDVLVEEVFE